MKRNRVVQKNKFDGTNMNSPPTFISTELDNESEEAMPSQTSSTVSTQYSQEIRKRQRTSHVSGDVKFECFFAALYNHLFNAIKPVYSNNKKLQNIKKKLLESKSLPQGIYQAGADMAGCSKEEIKDYFEKEPGIKLAKVYWKEFSAANFDSIVEDLGRPSSSSMKPSLSHVDFSCVQSKGDIQSIKSRILTSDTDTNLLMSPSSATSGQISWAGRSQSPEEQLSPLSWAGVSQIPEEHSSQMSWARGSQASQEHPSSLSWAGVSQAPQQKSSQTPQEQDKDLEFRSFQVPLNYIIRKGQSNEINAVFRKKIDKTLHDVSDYIFEFQFVINLMMLAFRNIEFTNDGTDHVTIQNSQGFRILDILPLGFQAQENIEYSSRPITEKIRNNKAMRAELNDLFEFLHLSRVNSAFFGIRGAQHEGDSKHNLQDFLNAMVYSTISRPLKEKGNIPSVIKNNALTSIVTNLKNMWTNGNIVTRLLNKLLNVLLRLHLAPKREEERRKNCEEKKSKAIGLSQEKNQHSKSGEGLNLRYLSRDSQRNILRDEHYLLKKYKKKAEKDVSNVKKQTRVKASEDRIKRFKEEIDKRERKKKEKNPKEDNKENTSEDLIADKEQSASNDLSIGEMQSTGDDMISDKQYPLTYEDILEEEDAEETADKDLSRRRLGCLKASIKAILFKRGNKKITEAVFREYVTDATENEVRVCLLIINLLSPYIPLKEHFGILIHQLPFALLANDILMCAGYSSSTVSICPRSSAPTTHAIRLDAPSLFSIMCAGKNKMRIVDGEGYNITNLDESRANKDFVFSSFFDINVITECCESHNLNFAHNITILPGLKEAAILGSKKNTSVVASAKSQNSKMHLSDDVLADISIERKKDDVTLTKEISDLNPVIENLAKRLKDDTKTFGKLDFGLQIREAKKLWIKKKTVSLTEEEIQLNNTTYQKINDFKIERYKWILKLQATTINLSSERYNQFIRKKAKCIDPKTYKVISVKKSIKDGTNGIEKADNVILDKKDINGYIFSGTDNGIVKMTDTVSFGIKRFQYHIELHNRYSALADPNEQDNIPEPEYIPLPEPFTITPADIDVGCGHWRRRKFLEKYKNATSDGKAVKEIEQELRKQSLQKAKSLEEAEQVHTIQLKHRKQLQDFYYSKIRLKKQRRSTINAKEFKEKLCKKERTYCHKKEEESRDSKEESRDSKEENREDKEEEDKNGKKRLIMFIGDKGKGVGSTIKGHRRYGGEWPSILHGRATNVLITNEDFTSKICPYCFHRLINPKKRNKKGKLCINHGTFWCPNPRCVSVKNNHAMQTRDSLSALSIGLVGLSMILFGTRIPSYSRYNISQYYTEFKNITSSFCKGSEGWAAGDSS